MMLPSSAADLPKKTIEKEKQSDESIFALVKGVPTFFTRKEAFVLASMLLISLEVDCNA